METTYRTTKINKQIINGDPTMKHFFLKNLCANIMLLHHLIKGQMKMQ